VTTARLATATALAGLAGLHALWATGSSWPSSDRAALASTIAGTQPMPGTRECVQVAGALAVASGLVAGVGGDRRLARLGRAGVATVLLGRGLAGVSGNTHRLVPWVPDAEFVRRDRRYFGPLCLALGAVAALSVRTRSRAV
jgi:hypothetical protein